MIRDNDRLRDFLGVTRWHKAGYTGRGVRVASAEDWRLTTHGYQTRAMLKEIAPDCLDSFLPMQVCGEADRFLTDTIPEMQGCPGFDIYFASISSDRDGSQYDEALEPVDTFIIMANGNFSNNPKGGYNQMLNAKKIYGCAAVRLDADGTVSTEPYSLPSIFSDFSGLAGFYVPRREGYAPESFGGTSCATPCVAGMAALVNEMALNRIGRMLIGTEMYNFLKDHCTDIGAGGFNFKTGWGLPILPDPKDVDIWNYIEKERNSMKFVDDVVIAPWAKPYVDEAKQLGIIQGDENGNFRPKDYVTREEMATMLMRSHRILSGGGGNGN